MSKYQKYSFELTFLTALSNWQRGWNENQDTRRDLADKLVASSSHLPLKFRCCNEFCFRKRFLVEGEIVKLLLKDDLFEGIGSWTTKRSVLNGFKTTLRPESKFFIIFKHKPLAGEVILNVNTLWKDPSFIQAIEEMEENDSELVKPLNNFKDLQGEVILRSTLKGSEIDQLQGMSSEFDEICDLGSVPLEEREALSISYAKNPNGILINTPILASRKATRNAIDKTIALWKLSVALRRKIYAISHVVHPNDLKHRL